MADWTDCRRCGGPVELDKRAVARWPTPDGKKIHLNGRCAACRSNLSRSSSDYVGLVWRHVADPAATFADAWRPSDVNWDIPPKLTPCGCPEFIAYFWSGDR